MDNLDIERMKASMLDWDLQNIRDDFPTLHQHIGEAPLAYLDNAASKQKPRQVMAAMNHFYMQDYSNVHRGVSTLSQRATAAYENARDTLKDFLNAEHREEIIFTSGATEAINLVAHSFGQAFLKKGDEVILTAMEHHSNIIPWQVLRDTIGIVLKIVPMNALGELDYTAFKSMLSSRTKLVSIVHISNVLGTINPIKAMTRDAHEVGAKVLIDGAQSAPHLRLDVQAIGCDFFVISGHKMYGPTGIGVLYGKKDLLEAVPPYQTGGSMVLTVSFDHTEYAPIPHKFEAGTPKIAEAIGLGAACRYLNDLGLDKIEAYEDELLHYATHALAEIPGLSIIGQAEHKAAVISFCVEGIHPHDLGSILDQEGIAVRAGHHCAMPIMSAFNVPATTRVSFGLYNTHAEVDALVHAIYTAKEIFKA